VEIGVGSGSASWGSKAILGWCDRVLVEVRGVYDLAYHQTEGIVDSLSKLLGVELSIPDNSTLNRHAKTLKVKLPMSEKGPIH